LSSIHESVIEPLDTFPGPRDDRLPVQRLKGTIAGASLLWALGLPMAAIAVAGQPHALTYAFAFTMYAIGSVVCHQLPDRSFHVAAVALPVCARCTGIYLGAAVASMLAATRRLPRPSHVVLWLLASALPTAATLSYEWTVGSAPSNWTRAAAGLALGFAVMTAVFSEVDQVGIR
jgi:uncharacterized membrane protein